MKKLTIALSIACAGALAFADNEQWQSDWFKGIGGTTDTSITDLKVTGGTWTIPEGAATFESSTLTLDLDTDAEALFAVSADAGDTKTAQKVTVSGVFTPCATSDLVSKDDMGTKAAQVGFAVVEDSAETSGYSYYAWVGGDSWEKIGACSSAEAETALTLTLNYWTSTVTATFAIKNGNSAIVAVTKTLTGTALTAAQANYKVASVACTGSGSLTQVDGAAQIGVAQIGDVKYGTVEAAVTAATEGATVKLIHEVDGNVTIPKTAKIVLDENGQKTGEIVNNGDVTIPLTTNEVAQGSGTYTYSIKAGETAKVSATTTDTSKECVVTKNTDNVTITVQTAKSVLNGMTFTSNSKAFDISTTEKEAAFRAFLTKNGGEAYTKANTSSDAIKTALEKTGDNKLALWQDYALGIEPSTTLAVKPVEKDEATDKITLALATTVAPTGDFTIKYNCNGTSVTDASKIEVPMTTSHYPITITFE